MKTYMNMAYRLKLGCKSEKKIKNITFMFCINYANSHIEKRLFRGSVRTSYRHFLCLNISHFGHVVRKQSWLWYPPLGLVSLK